ncbi:class I SAM-dependent methyltransferase [Sphingomonas morindae]|uniref:Class I SAM-dependent methyltransferase n=1 Tax=Sphingomonas morindae TaxID=1541170 RepID=A0ABY4XB84_9SPHN|nr:class I SAM-dependent methyltransferase [Sphingomonas morindae]USI74206.1 class I SAM-dependent methyltransferase [Sphingomonas morindae]
MERAIYERMAEIDGEHWWFTARRQIVAQAIRDRVTLPPAPRILEIGAGTGANLPMLAAFGTVDAVEPDEAARALASRRSGIAVKGGLLPHAVALPDGGYDLIVLLDVLEHIPDDRGALTVLRAKLAPGGTLLMTVPAAPWMWSAHDVAHHHHRRYTARSFAAVMRDGGFRVRHLSHFNTLLFPLIAGVRLLHRLTGREGGDDALPGATTNRMLARIFAAERYWVTRRALPFGVSLLAIAEPS